MPSQMSPETIPCSRILLDYWGEDGDFRTAFVRWADQLTAGYDRYKAGDTSWRDDIDMAAVRECLNGNTVTKYSGLRTILRPHHGNGTTLRDLAALTNVDLPSVVGACFSNKSAARADQYADLEEDLLANGCKNLSAIQKKHGIHPQSKLARRIAERHGLDLATQDRYASKWSQAFRDEAVGLLIAGLPPAQTLKTMKSRHPKLEEFPSRDLLFVWRRREEGRRERRAAVA